LTTTFILGNLHRHNEITAMRASGLGLSRIIAPFVVLGLLAATATFVANEYVMPTASLRYEQMKNQYFEDQPKRAATLREHVALLGRNNRLYYVGSYDPATLTLRDVTILEHDAQRHLTGKIYARSARWEHGQWVFVDGAMTRLDGQGNSLGPPETFAERPMFLAEQPEHFEQAEIRPDLMRFFQLRAYIDQVEVATPGALRRLRVELAYKLSIPWACVIMALLGVPFSLSRHRGGMLSGMGMSVLLGVMYYGVFAVSVALGQGGTLAPGIAVWLPHGLFFGVAVALLQRIR